MKMEKKKSNNWETKNTKRKQWTDKITSPSWLVWLIYQPSKRWLPVSSRHWVLEYFSTSKWPKKVVFYLSAPLSSGSASPLLAAVFAASPLSSTFNSLNFSTTLSASFSEDFSSLASASEEQTERTSWILEQSKQVRLVSAEAERSNHPSRVGGGGVASQGGGLPPRQRQHVHDSIRPIRLTVALGLKTNKFAKQRFSVMWGVSKTDTQFQVIATRSTLASDKRNAGNVGTKNNFREGNQTKQITFFQNVFHQLLRFFELFFKFLSIWKRKWKYLHKGITRRCCFSGDADERSQRHVSSCVKPMYFNPIEKEVAPWFDKRDKEEGKPMAGQTALTCPCSMTMRRPYKLKGAATNSNGGQRVWRNSSSLAVVIKEQIVSSCQEMDFYSQCKPGKGTKLKQCDCKEFCHLAEKVRGSKRCPHKSQSQSPNRGNNRIVHTFRTSKTYRQVLRLTFSIREVGVCCPKPCLFVVHFCFQLNVGHHWKTSHDYCFRHSDKQVVLNFTWSVFCRGGRKNGREGLPSICPVSSKHVTSPSLSSKAIAIPQKKSDWLVCTYLVWKPQFVGSAVGRGGRFPLYDVGKKKKKKHHKLHETAPPAQPKIWLLNLLWVEISNNVTFRTGFQSARHLFIIIFQPQWTAFCAQL